MVVHQGPTPRPPLSMIVWRPPLQLLLFDILLWIRMRKHCVTGDIQKAFLQIRVHKQNRDAQQVLWYDNLTDRNKAEYRFM